MYVVVTIRKGWNGGNEVTVSQPYDSHNKAEQARRRGHLDHVLGDDYTPHVRDGFETHVCQLDMVSA